MSAIRITIGSLIFGLALLCGGVASAAACQTPQPATTASERIVCTSPRPNTEVWRIDQPNVVQRQTTYDAIRFQKDDLVLVFAGGCVQTGGPGLTWKRYVNPMMAWHRDDDNQYHGLIQIPGFGGLRHVRDAVLQGGIPVASDPGAGAALVLGYVDDGYSDNGYSSHDDGWWQQCQNLPDAWIVIVIEHDCAQSTAPQCIRGRALDLVTENTDPNGFPMNPSWVWTEVTGVDPAATDVCSFSKKIGGMPVDDASLCVSQPTQRDYSGVCASLGSPGNLEGHMNWTSTSVTYRGGMWWDGYDKWDKEYTFDIAGSDQYGNVQHSLFVSGEYSPQLEFDTRETINNFDSVPWWKNLHSAIDSGKVDTFLPNTLDLYTIGQLNLDCAHTCGMEIHPAWVVFLHVKNDVNDDTWEFFVKNWGDQGFCASDDHQASFTQITIPFQRYGATSVAIASGTYVGETVATPPYTVSLKPGGGGAFATFTLPPSNQHGVIFGELHLKWRTALTAAQLDNLEQLMQGVKSTIHPVPYKRPGSAREADRMVSAAHDAALVNLRGQIGAKSEDDSVEAQLSQAESRASPSIRAVLEAAFTDADASSQPLAVRALQGRVAPPSSIVRPTPALISTAPLPPQPGDDKKGVALQHLLVGASPSQ